MNDEIDAKTSRLAQFAMAVAWSSFLMAGVMEMLVFSVVDPSELSWFGGARIELSRQAVYTLSFLIFWSVIAIASSLCLLLTQLPEPPARPHPRQWPR
jgi:hypothetical protein